MGESKLPPGPWRANEINFLDVDRNAVREFVFRDSDGERIELHAFSEVLRAIEALPLLVEAARGVTAMVERQPVRHATLYRQTPEYLALRDALALVDGEKETSPP